MPNDEVLLHFDPCGIASLQRWDTPPPPASVQGRCLRFRAVNSIYLYIYIYICIYFYLFSIHIFMFYSYIYVFMYLCLLIFKFIFICIYKYRSSLGLELRVKSYLYRCPCIHANVSLDLLVRLRGVRRGDELGNSFSDVMCVPPSKAGRACCLQAKREEKDAHQGTQKPKTPNPKPQTLVGTPSFPFPKPETLNPKPSALNPKPPPTPLCRILGCFRREFSCHRFRAACWH